MELAIIKAGGSIPLARQIGTTRQLVEYWAKRSKKGAAADFVLRIEEATGVSRYQLRPDVYGREEAAA